jgi:Protein of unknown function (DUF2628)
MIVFTIHEQPDPPADRIDRAEKLEFVRDGFTPLAAALPPLWMAMNRLWIVLLGYLLAAAAASLILKALGVSAPLIALINVAANLVIGFEADSLKRWTLGRRGWAEVGSVVGRNRDECERRFFDGWLVQQPILRTASQMGRPARPENQSTSSALSGPNSSGGQFQPASTPPVTTAPPDRDDLADGRQRPSILKRVFGRKL